MFSGINHVGNGIFDVFVAKYDPAGNLLWLRSAGGIQSDVGFGIKTDKNANVYVAGHFSEIAEFRDDRGVIVHLPSSGNTDIFIAKYDSSGNLLWAKKAGGVQEDEATNLTIDAQDNIFITGYFSETCYFGSKMAISNGNTDVFVARYDTSGSCQWVQTLGGTGLDKGFGIAVDSSGNSYINGFFYYTAMLSNSLTTLVGDGLSSDIFVAKYDPDGNNKWAFRIGGYYNDAAFGIVADKEENFYITGYFLEVAEFGDIELDANGYNDIFIAKYDSTLKCEWAINEGGVHLDMGLDIGLDETGSVYVAGTFDSIGFFGNDTLYTVDYYDMFISKYNDKGILQWVRQAGGDMGDFALSLCVQQYDLVYVTGYYKVQAMFGSIESFFGAESDAFTTKIAFGVGVEETNESLSPLSIYPNPNDGAFTLRFPPGIQRDAIVTVTDAQGKEIFREKRNVLSNADMRLELPVAGIYFITVQDQNSSRTGRVAVFR